MDSFGLPSGWFSFFPYHSYGDTITVNCQLKWRQQWFLISATKLPSITSYRSSGG